MSTEGVTSDGGMDEADGSEARVSIPLRNGLVEGSAGEEKSFLRSIGNRDDVDIGEKTTRGGYSMAVVRLNYAQQGILTACKE